MASPTIPMKGCSKNLKITEPWGVPHIWVIEPRLKKLQVYQSGTLAQVQEFEMPEFGFRLSEQKLFDEASGR
jgi:hypothetical protein